MRPLQRGDRVFVKEVYDPDPWGRCPWGIYEVIFVDGHYVQLFDARLRKTLRFTVGKLAKLATPRFTLRPIGPGWTIVVGRLT